MAWTEVFFTESKMTLPRMFLPECTHHSIGRFTDGRFFTPPLRTIIDAFLMIVWKNSRRYDIGIAGWALMGNHPHLAVFDRDPRRASRVPKFRQQVHSQFAKFLKAYWGVEIDEILGTDCVSQLFPVIDDVRVCSTLVYIMTNPAAADLVEHGSEMPLGAVSLPWMLERPIEVQRPDFWFAKRTWPEKIELKLEKPPTVDLSIREWRAKLEVAVYIEECALIEFREETGIELKGVEWATSKTPDDRGKVIKNKKHVLFAGSDPRLLARQYLRNRRFLRGYKKAMGHLREGKRSVVFPYGTGQMCASHGHRMHLPPG